MYPTVLKLNKRIMKSKNAFKTELNNYLNTWIIKLTKEDVFIP